MTSTDRRYFTALRTVADIVRIIGGRASGRARPAATSLEEAHPCFNLGNDLVQPLPKKAVIP